MRTATYVVLIAAMLTPATGQAQQDPNLIGEGARVYAANCARCHNARSSMERTDEQWALVVSHMRSRANFTKAEAQAVLAYLQATNLPEGPTGVAAADFRSIVAPPSLERALGAAARARARLDLLISERAPTRGEPGEGTPH